MKNNALTLIILFFIFSLFFVSCSTTANPITSATKAQPQADTQALPQEPDLTEAPPPLPCTITFDSDRDGNREIYRMAPDGSDTVNLSNNRGDDFDPAWSPDGSQIAFVSNRENGQEGSQFIYVMNADGSNVRQLTFENGSNWPDWSHDGSRITYTSNDDVFVINADGSGQSINITNNPEKDAQSTWSPDGKKIAWISNRTIFVMDADGSNIRQLTKEGTSDGVEWTVDGQIFTGMDNVTGMDNKTSSCHNCVMDAAGKNIISGGGKGELQRYIPFWTMDGHRVEVANVDIFIGDNEIYLVSEIYPDIFLNLTNNPADDRNPDWPANCGPGTDVAITDIEQPKEDPGQIIIGYAGDNPEQWQRKNNFQKACSELGNQCVYGEIPELVEQGVDAIVQNSSPEKIKDAASAINEATKKGIPVFVLDAEIDMDGVYSVMADPGEMISVTLKNLLKESGGAGDFAYFDFSPSQKDSQLIKDVLEKEYPKVKVVTTDTERFNFKDDEFIFNDLVIAYPSLKAVWTNSGYTNAVFGIVNNISSPENYPMINCEPSKVGFYIWKDRTTDHPGFECVIVSNPPGIAYDAVYAAYYMVSGEKIDESTLEGQYGNAFVVDFPVITNENLAKWMDIINYERDDFVADQLMTPEEIKVKWFLE